MRTLEHHPTARPDALAMLESTHAAEALVGLACRLTEGCAGCRETVDAVPVAVLAARRTASPIVAALYRLRSPASWGPLSHDHLDAVARAQRGKDWGAFAFVVLEEAVAHFLADPSQSLESFTPVEQLAERLAERHRSEPKVLALRAKLHADLVAAYCRRRELAAAAVALDRAQRLASSCDDKSLPIHLHVARADLARCHGDRPTALHHLRQALLLTGPGPSLRALELIARIASLLVRSGEPPGAVVGLVELILANLQPRRAGPEAIFEANRLYRRGQLLALLAHGLVRLGVALFPQALQAAQELEAAGELFERVADRHAQGLRHFVLGQLWALGQAHRSSPAWRAALEIFEELGDVGLAAEARKMLANLLAQLPGGTVN